MVLIFVNQNTSRLRYIFNLLFADLMGLTIRFTSEPEEFEIYNGPKLSYGKHALGQEAFFQSVDLLFETGINEQQISVRYWEGIPVFFSVGKNSLLPFDVFAASFYLVSRYEEYLPHIRDVYDRFEAKNSLAFNHDFLKKPLVNMWAKKVSEKLKERYPDLHIKKPSFEFVSTIDVDNAYAYKEKGLMRTMGGYLKALSKLDFSEAIERTKVLLSIQPDPNDTYDYHLQLQKKYGFKCIYFILLGDYGVNDKNIKHQNRKFQSLIKYLGDYANVGIHPSFASNEKVGQVKKEVDRLANILHRDVNASRQHFLKLSLPETYRELIDCDITDDYTMGYASQIGFRASICTPFNFYDLDNEIETKLKVHPFAYMEGTFKYYMDVSKDEVLDHLKPLLNTVYDVGGTFVSLWHNDSLSDIGVWKGWRSIYEDMLQEIYEKRQAQIS